ncbi:MAG: bacillithiol biosynthesis cysteine-adding enzyme BshC [Acidobacteriia bacterium]|nr:bacillithiol biosynthesis cysteine-adding enzyme BshC [Terriglobia bacterium]
MEPACIRHTDLPGTSRLFADFTYHFDRVARFYRHNPHDPAALEAAAAQVNYPDERRAAMVRALVAQNGETESLRRLAEPGTVAIVTGQQVGLFSGPAYTVYKAITAARLARELTARGTPAVPIFWLATEDHDFPEVNHAWIFGPAHEPVMVEAPGETNGRQRPVGGIVLEQPPVEALASALAGFPHSEEVIALVREAYQPGVTMGEGFRALVKKLLAKLDLIFLDPLDPAIRAISAPVVAEALGAAPELKKRLLARNRELESAGYHAQVHLEEKTSLFFLLQNGERVPLRRANSDFTDLRDRAAEVSPNALLRPVVQDYLLPTVAYIGGPAELAYLAQAEVIYDRLLGRMPVVMSRTSFTLLEPRTEKLLKRYRLAVPETFVDPEHLRERIARSLVPDAVERAFADAHDGMTHNIDCLHAELERFDHTLADSLKNAKTKMLYQLEKTRRKIERETMRRDERAAAEARYLSGLLFPHRHLQERFYSILPFLAKHGVDLIDNLYDAAQLDCPDHHVYTI